MSEVFEVNCTDPNADVAIGGYKFQLRFLVETEDEAKNLASLYLGRRNPGCTVDSVSKSEYSSCLKEHCADRITRTAYCKTCGHMSVWWRRYGI